MVAVNEQTVKLRLQNINRSGKCSFLRKLGRRKIDLQTAESVSRKTNRRFAEKMFDINYNRVKP